MMIDKKNLTTESDNTASTITPDENTGVMVFGNIKIEDLDTNEIIVNKRA